ncbi:hypothetical protein I4U23_027985 [Adineta vaga]|nr:hypothetical protein I4U23_027985 [Adineta vaga]
MQSPSDDIQKVLLTTIEKSRIQCPEQYSKPIHVLDTVHANVQDQFEVCLQQESKALTGERIVLIPYDVENSHWAVISLDFDATESIKKAEYIDPVNGIDIVPEKLQKQFTNVYPSDELRARTLQKQDSFNNSATLTMTVENLLRTTNVKPSRSENVPPSSTCTAMACDGNQIRELKHTLNCDTVGELPKDIQNGQKQRGTERDQERISERVPIVTDTLSTNSTDKQGTQLISPSANERFIIDKQSKKQFFLNDLRKDSASMPSCTEKTILELLIYFKERLLGYTSSAQQENLLSEKIQNIFTDLKKPLNVREVERLVLKAKETAELIRNKDVVFLIGNTGCGKSTTIQLLAGCRMIGTKVESSPGMFLDHISTDGSIESRQLANVNSSPFNRPETRCIAPVTVKLKNILGKHEESVIILCDTPGFGDTAGIEVDIANSLGVIEALKQTKSVKLLVLSSYDNLGRRGAGIQALAQVLVNMFGETIEDKFSSILYAFTKFPKKTDVSAILMDIRRWRENQDTTSNSDRACVAVLDDMIKKAKEKTVIIDPIHDHPKESMNKLKTIDGIQSPTDVFHFPMSDETKSNIYKHVQRNKDNIDCMMKQKNIELVLYYLNDWKKLIDLLQQDDIEEDYTKYKRSISNSIDKYRREVIERFNRAMVSQDGLKENDIKDYEIAVKYFQQIHIIKEHIGSSLPSPNDLIQNVNEQLEKRESVLNGEDLDNPHIGIYLGNFYMLKTLFNELETPYNTICNMLERRFDKLVHLVHEFLLKNDFTYIAEIVVKISKSTDHLQDPILAKIQLQNDDISILKKNLDVLKAVKENYILREHVYKYIEMMKRKHELLDDTKDLDKIYDEYIGKIMKYFDEIDQRIERLFENDGDNVLDDVRKLVNDMKIIRNIPEIESKTAVVYNNTIGNIHRYMYQLQENAHQTLYTSNEQSGSIDYSRLVRSLSRLTATQWINRDSPKTYERLMDRLRIDLIQHAQDLENRVRNLDLSLKYPDNVCIAQESIDGIKSV